MLPPRALALVVEWAILAALFRAVTVDSTLGTIAWPNGADLDPDVLISGRTPA